MPAEMTFQEKLELYAKLIVYHGMNVEEGQDVYINSEVIHKDLAHLVAKEAYRAGARIVVTNLIDPELLRTRILESKEEYLTHVPSYIPYKMDQMIPETAASVRIIGSEDPDLYADLDPKKLNQVQLSLKSALKNFYKEGVGHSKVQWTIAAAATPKWAKKVFPDLGEQAATNALWNDIFHICRVDQPDCLELWKKHNDVLHKRAHKLTALEVETLHFKGPGTDLKVGLSERAKFVGGGSPSPRGREFEPNLPTEEVFSTPDWRRTEGHATATRPFLINGEMIRGLKLTFKEGQIVDFEADQGYETFKEYISSDEGANQLGEVALVGINSPIYQTGRVYEEILFDENAACHIAVGFAYHFCIQDSEGMSEEELAELGVNNSSVHTDMMISSEEVDIHALTRSGKEIPLIVKGEWVDEYR